MIVYHISDGLCNRRVEENGCLCYTTSMKQTRTPKPRKMAYTVDRKNATRNSLLSQTALTQIENTHTLLMNVKDLLMKLVSPNLNTTIGDLCETICSVQEHIAQMHTTIVLMREDYAKMSKEEREHE
jgi:hypothetical protein